MHVNLAPLIRECSPQVCFAGGEATIHSHRAITVHGYLLKTTRPHVESDVNCLHADVSSFDLFAKTIGDKKQDDYPAGDICCLKFHLMARLSSYHWTRGDAMKQMTAGEEAQRAE